MRASRKSLFKRFCACGPPANHFLKVLVLAGLPQITFLKVWCFRAWRKSFPKGFGVSAFSESYFPNSLGLVVAKIWNKNLSGFWIYNYQGASIGTVSTIFSTYFVLHKKSFYGIKSESKFKTLPFYKNKKRAGNTFLPTYKYINITLLLIAVELLPLNQDLMLHVHSYRWDQV